MVDRLMQFVVSMGPTVAAMERGSLDSLRLILIMVHGIIYIRGNCDQAIPALLEVNKLLILAKSSGLAKLIMIEAIANEVLTRSCQRAWIVRVQYLASKVCRLCPKCMLLNRKLADQLIKVMSTIQICFLGFCRSVRV